MVFKLKSLYQWPNFLSSSTNFPIAREKKNITRQNPKNTQFHQYKQNRDTTGYIYWRLSHTFRPWNNCFNSTKCTSLNKKKFFKNHLRVIIAKIDSLVIYLAGKNLISNIFLQQVTLKTEMLLKNVELML